MTFLCASLVQFCDLMVENKLQVFSPVKRTSCSICSTAISNSSAAIFSQKFCTTYGKSYLPAYISYIYTQYDEYKQEDFA